MNANGRSDGKSTLVQVMAWCRQATSHYLSQCWPRSLSSLGHNELTQQNITKQCAYFMRYTVFFWDKMKKNDFFFYLPGQKSKRPKPHRTYSSTETKSTHSKHLSFTVHIVTILHCYNAILVTVTTPHLHCYNPILAQVTTHTYVITTPYLNCYKPILTLLQPIFTVLQSILAVLQLVTSYLQCPNPICTL